MLDQYSLISRPYPRLNCSKTLPFTAAHTYIAYVLECSPPPPHPGDKHQSGIFPLGLNMEVKGKGKVWFRLVACQTQSLSRVL